MNVLVLQGAGMDQRGKSQIDVFGPETLDDINALIRSAADALDLQVEIFFSNDEAEAAAFVESAAARIGGCVINPAFFTPYADTLVEAVRALEVPVIEVHGSNPNQRGVTSVFAPVCTGTVYGFGYAGYGVALQALAESVGGST